MTLSLKKIRHITFADEYYMKSAYRLSESASRYGITTEIYDPSQLPDEFWQVNRSALSHKKGFGLWCWKPVVAILEVEKMQYGEVLLYTDAGLEFVADPAMLLPLLEIDDIAFFELGLHPERRWTKRLVLEELGITANMRETNQRTAGIFLIRKSRRSLEFLHAWKENCQRYELINEEGTSYSNDEFMSHRHDQSILSVLSKKYGYPAHRDPSQFGLSFRTKADKVSYPQIINWHRKSKLPFMRRIEKSLLPKIRRLWVRVHGVSNDS